MSNSCKIQNAIITARDITGKEYLPDIVLDEVVPTVVYDKSLNLPTVATIWSAYMEALSDTLDSNINAAPDNYKDNVEGRYLKYVSVLRKLIMEADTYVIQGTKTTVVNCYWWDAPFIARIITFGGSVPVTYYNNKAKVWSENEFIKENIERYISEHFIVEDSNITKDDSKSIIKSLLGVKKYTSQQVYVVN